MLRNIRIKSFLRKLSLGAVMLVAIFILASCFGGILSGTMRYKYVNTMYGQVRGRVAHDGDYLAFLGIPYAAPPTGENRFQEPKPVIPWNGTFDAVRKVKCAQMGEGEEDCLVLNIFTPTKLTIDPLPVLFYIHGGSFIMGSGQTEGVDHLIKRNIIVVTINYRLGVLGFLCLGTKDAPGNAGLKDQVAALAWVHENIANFGGNPRKVTVYGMSAGAASVEYLILSKMSSGLFRNSIIESGSSTPVWAIDAHPVATAVNFAKRMNLTIDYYLRSLARRYKLASVEALTNANFEYYTDLVDGSFGFVPCVEKLIQGVEPFMTMAPQDVLVTQDIESVPVMFIFSSTEGLYLRSEEYYKLNYKERMETNFIDFVPADLMFETTKLKNDTAIKIKEFYFGDDPVKEDDKIIDYLNYFGDSLVLHGLLNSALSHAMKGNSVFLMEFAYKGKMGSYEKFYESLDLAGHGDAIKHAILIKPVTTEEDRIAVERMSSFVANFAKFSYPTPIRDEYITVMWPTVHPAQNLTYMHMGKDLQIHYELTDSYTRRKNFWDQLYQKYRRPLRPVNPRSYSVYRSNT